MKTTPWVPSALMAELLGIHPDTLRSLRRHPLSPFKEGRDFRRIGLTTSSRLQWQVESTLATFTDFRRIPASQVETFAAAEVK